MVEVIAHVAAGVGLFAGGLYLGSHKNPTIAGAIAAIDAAEKNAQAVLSTITAHKAK